MNPGSCADWIPADLLEHADAYASKQAFDADRGARAGELDARYRRAVDAIGHAGAEGASGHCPLCDAPVHFASPDHASDAPNLREGLVCNGCGSNARARAGLSLLDALCPDRSAPVYITEQASAAYRWLHAHRRTVIGSEFERDWRRRLKLSRYLWSRRTFAFVRYEDVTCLRLRTGSQRAVVSFDVIEHVPDDRAALREFARVTGPGGWLVLTAPFGGGESSIERARLRADGSVEHLHPPEYHGDPLGGGVLCFRHYGWDLLDHLREAGFADAAVVVPYWPEAGLFDGLLTIVARR